MTEAVCGLNTMERMQKNRRRKGPVTFLYSRLSGRAFFVLLS